MSTITNFALIPVTADQIGSTDLQDILRNEADVRFECYRIESNDVAEAGKLIYDPASGRAGIAWSADGIWTDCASAEDAVERFLGLNGKEMVN